MMILKMMMMVTMMKMMMMMMVTTMKMMMMMMTIMMTMNGKRFWLRAGFSCFSSQKPCFAQLLANNRHRGDDDIDHDHDHHDNDHYDDDGVKIGNGRFHPLIRYKYHLL